MNRLNLVKIVSQIKDIKGDSLRLPLPRRATLEPVMELRKVVWGPYWDSCVNIASRQLSTSEMLQYLERLPGFSEHMSKMGQAKQGLISNLILMRHQASKGPIFTVSENLSRMLDDTNVSADIPSRFFVAPFKTCYIEFHPAEQRDLSNLPLLSMGLSSMSEGCYLQERHFEKFPLMDRETVEFFELDRSQPLRIVEIGFSGSPFNNPDAGELPAAMDVIDYATIYIQDEDQPLSEVLSKHFEFYAGRNKDIALSEKDAIVFQENFERCFKVLTRILFYLNIERKEQRVERTATDLQKRIDGVADKKKDKLKKQLYRAYDRIVIGPEKYISIEDRMASEVGVGRVRPHYRRATIGIRWVGTGDNKKPELRRIKESVVNAHLMKSKHDKHSDYIIK